MRELGYIYDGMHLFPNLECVFILINALEKHPTSALPWSFLMRRVLRDLTLETLQFKRFRKGLSDIVSFSKIEIVNNILLEELLD